MTQSDKKEKDKEMRKAESVPEKGKQLSRKAADKLKFYGVAAVLSLLCAGFIWFIFKPDTTETVEGYGWHQYNDTRRYRTGNDDRQTEGLRTGADEEAQAGKVRTLQDIAGDYLIPDTSDGLKPEKAAPEQDAIRESRQQQQQISRQIASFYQEPKDNPRVSDLERQVKELNEKLERERKGQDPLELMEKSYEMAARYFPGQAGGQVKSIQSGGPSGNPAAIAAGRATESVVSSLAAPSAPDTIPRNYGFATAVGAGQPAGTNTIRACVAEDQTVTTGA